MAKAVLRALILAAMGLIGTLLADLSKKLAHKTHLSVTQGVMVCLAALIVGYALLYVLEKQRALAVNWWWHRIWYLRGLRQDLERSAPNASASIVEVDHKGVRSALIPFLLAAIKAHRNNRLRILVIGDSGTGKSVAMTQLAWQLASASRWWPSLPMPILCRMGRFSTGTLLEFAERQLALLTAGNSGAVLSAGLKRLLQRRRAILLLDAMDETPEASSGELGNDLEELSKPAFGDPPVISTTRSLDPQVAALSRQVSQTLEIQDLSDPAVDRMIAQHLGGTAREQIEAIHSRLVSQELLGRRGLARNPFWLARILESQVFATNKIKVLDSAIKTLLREELAKAHAGQKWAKLPNADEQIDHTYRSLEGLAIEMTRDRLAEMSFDCASAQLKPRLEQTKLVPSDVLYLGRDALLLEFRTEAFGVRPPDIGFRHHLVRQFYAASGLFSAPELLNEKVFGSLEADDRWWDAIVVLNEVFQANSKYDRHDSLVRNVFGTGSSGRRLILAAGLLWRVDKLLHEDLTREIVSCFRAHCAQPDRAVDL